MVPNKTFGTFRLVLLFLSCAAFISTTFAQTTNTITFNDFSDASTLHLNGNAHVAATADGQVLELTQAITNQSGSAFPLSPVFLATNGSFSAFFKFRFTPAGSGGADGIAFIVQSVGNSALGNIGGSFGYGGIASSVCVEYDTYRNISANDPPGNHVAFDFNGVLGGTNTAATPSSLEDGNIWYSWVDYSGVTGQLEVRLSETNSRPVAPLLATNINLMSYVVSPNVYFGFSGSTGANVHQQDVLAWQLTVINPVSPIVSDQFIIEAGGYSSSPRVYSGQNEASYASTGFGHSTATASAPGCTATIGSDYGTHGLTNPPISSVTLSPQFKVANGRYLLEAVVPTTSNESTDLTVDVSASNSTGLSSNTAIFASSSINQWHMIGTLQLTNGATNDTITLIYASGQIDGNHRWYSSAYRFTYLGDPGTVQTLTNPPGNFGLVLSSAGTNYQDPFGLTIDNQENIFITGEYSGTILFPGTNFTSKGLVDMFLVKYDKTGNFLWAKTGGSTTNDLGYSVATDSSGNVYVAGRFGRTATFDAVTLTSAGDEEIFLAKYDVNGNLLWAKRAGSNSYDFAKKVVVDESGNIYIAGGCRGSSTFGTITINCYGISDAFLAKYDPNGNALWVQHWGGSGSFYTDAHGMTRDAAGNLYLTGFYQGTMTVGTTTLTNAGGQDIFVIKADSSGNPIWAVRAGGPDHERGLDTSVDNAGNVFVTGHYAGPITFGATSFPSDGSDDMFLAKWDVSGNFQWAKSAHSSAEEEGDNVKCDHAGNVYVTGHFNDVATFSPYAFTSVGSDDAFLAKYDTTGNLLMLQQIGSGNSDWGRVLTINSNNSVYWAGAFAGTVTFGNKVLTNNGGLNVFLVRYDEVPPLTASNFVVSSNQVVLSWSTNYVGFVLQTSIDLSSPQNWIDSAIQPTLVNDHYLFTNTLSGAAKYFRLRR